ncbi:hypothetical protein Hanom_Chr04g00381511 [Helianthus anomalus]
MEKYTKPERKPPAKLLLSRKLNFMKRKKAFCLLRSERSRSCGYSHVILMWLNPFGVGAQLLPLCSVLHLLLFKVKHGRVFSVNVILLL